MTFRFANRFVLLLVLFDAGLAGAWEMDSNTTFDAGATVKEGYDDNVYLQDVAPNPAVPNAVPANKRSFYTVVTPDIRFIYRASSNFVVNFAYDPEIGLYYDVPSENYVAHRFAVTLSGTTPDFEWQQKNSFVYVDGNRVNPTFGQTDGVPIMGGLAIRDRHAALIYHGGFNVTVPIGQWFVRPVVTAYVHDFLTEQHPNPTNAAGVRIGTYENYVDRWELGGGFDAGREVFTDTKVFVGYRYGHQEQGSDLGVPGQFSNDYQRFLLGIEGKPASWLKFDMEGGPDLRQWPDNTPAGFDRHEFLWFVDASATLTPVKSDDVTLTVTRYLQPAFTSESVYEDIRYAADWQHRFTDNFSAGPGFALQIGNWRTPVNRKDWIYTPSLTMNYLINKHFAVEGAYYYNWGQSHVPNLEGIEYHQNIGTIAVKCHF